MWLNIRYPNIHAIYKNFVFCKWAQSISLLKNWKNIPLFYSILDEKILCSDWLSKKLFLSGISFLMISFLLRTIQKSLNCTMFQFKLINFFLRNRFEFLQIFFLLERNTTYSYINMQCIKKSKENPFIHEKIGNLFNIIFITSALPICV